MRLIDADAFEDVLNEKLLPILIKNYGKEEALRGLHFSFRDVICNIQSQPTINQWIPCSEQMPPIGKTVLVTVKTSNKTWTDCDTWFQGDWMGYMGSDREVIAWRELPEPYKEDTK